MRQPRIPIEASQSSSPIGPSEADEGREGGKDGRSEEHYAREMSPRRDGQPQSEPRRDDEQRDATSQPDQDRPEAFKD